MTPRFSEEFSGMGTAPHRKLVLVFRCPTCERIVYEAPAHMSADGSVSNTDIITLGALYCPDHGQLPNPVSQWVVVG